MDQRIIELNQAFMQKGLAMAYINAHNLETGFLTGQIRNRLTRTDMEDHSTSLRYITRTIAINLQENDISLNSQQAGMIFQFCFDRSVEVGYKHFNGIDLSDVSFDIQEAFEYYEPDVPYNIQQVLTNRVGNIAMLTAKLWQYMDETGVFDTPFSEWFANFLSVATTLGLLFATEIDFDDESELNAFLNLD